LKTRSENRNLDPQEPSTMLAPLIVTPLITCTLIVLAGWIYDTVVARFEDETACPLNSAAPCWQSGQSWSRIPNRRL
jgi:hypothetical protein